MGLFSRDPGRPPRQSFRDAMAAADAKNRERRERAEARIDDGHREQELLHAATDPIRPQIEREDATAELVAMVGEAKARKLIGARSRLQRRGWIRP